MTTIKEQNLALWNELQLERLKTKNICIKVLKTFGIEGMRALSKVLEYGELHVCMQQAKKESIKQCDGKLDTGRITKNVTKQS